jgi:hypothetical protein
MRIRQLLLQILQEKHDMHYFFLTAKTISCQSTCTHSEDTQGSFDVICHSSFDRMFSCSAQTANPTCAQSFDLHSLQNRPLSLSLSLSLCNNFTSSGDTFEKRSDFWKVYLASYPQQFILGGFLGRYSFLMGSLKLTFWLSFLFLYMPLLSS